MKKTILIALACVALGACSQPRDADWYEANPKQATKRLHECQELAAKGKVSMFDDSKESVDCQNAAEGMSRNVIKSLGF